MKINVNMPPPKRGGWDWTYQEGPVLISGFTHSDLVKNLAKWRIDNHRPMGNPAADIEEQICSLWPHFCIKEAKDTARPKADAGVVDAGHNNLGRVTEFAARLYKLAKEGIRYVLLDEAERRAKICSRCNRNEIWESGCGSCIQATKTQLKNIIKDRTTSLDSELRACGVCGSDLKSIVHIAKDQLNITENQKVHLPKQCWKLNN